MPSSPSDPVLQFDSIEETIKAFSESLVPPILLAPPAIFAQFRQSVKALTGTISIGNGEFIIALDSQDRENEGDLIIAAESITDAQMAFLVRFTR